MTKLISTLLVLFAAVGFSYGQTCTAGFTWAMSPQGNNLLRVVFTNTSSITPPSGSTIKVYSLNFGDNSSTSNFVQSATHNYAAPGTYTAVLSMTAIDSMTQQVLCTSSFTAQVVVSYSGCATSISSTNTGGGTWQFTATTPAGTNPMSYAWNFGDGGTSTLQNPTHTYANGGTYTVTLMASGGGCTYTNTTTVQYNATSVNCSQLTASFSYSISNNVVYFTNTSTPVNSTPATTRVPSWNFGDGGTGTANIMSHAYATGGVYTVTLINYWKDSMSQQTLCSDTIQQLVTVANPQNVISGSIWWDSTLNAPAIQSTFKVWLIEHDAVNNTLTAIDSTVVTGNMFVPYSFSGKAAGQYRTKAARLNGTVGVTGLVPTYHDSSLYWSNAVIINHTGGTTANQNIKLKQGLVTSGPGFIGGNISLGANKGTGSGAPDLLVLLRNTSNKLIAFTYTDANGDYSFSNLQVGTYNVYPEEINHTTIPSSMLLVSSSVPAVIGVDFERNSTDIKPKNLGTGDLNDAQLFSIYPNPSNGEIVISWKSNSNDHADLIVTDVTGRVVLVANAETNSSSRLSLTTMEKGIYFISAVTSEGRHTEKIVLEK